MRNEGRKAAEIVKNENEQRHNRQQDNREV